MNCICRVNKYKTRPARIICDRPAVLYNVSGMLSGLELALCSRHARRFVAIGLIVEKATPLEQLAGKAEEHRKRGLRTQAKPGEFDFVSPVNGSPA